MTSVHEQLEHVTEHIDSIEQITFRVRFSALVFVVLAMIYSVTSSLSISAQVRSQRYNLQGTELLTFAEAKFNRMTTVQVAAQVLETEIAGETNAAVRDAKRKLAGDLQKLYERYETDPDSGEGRKELLARARMTEHDRNRADARLGHYQLASNAIQLGMWLAFGGIITGMIMLPYIAIGMGLMGMLIFFAGIIDPMLLRVLVDAG
jgi:hypothetical protein